MKKYLFFALVVALWTIACAGGKQKPVGYIPEVHRIETEEYTFSVAPHLIGAEFVGFDLKLENKSESDIEIVWDRSLYIENGRTSGRFWVAGTPYYNRYGSKPSDIVFPGSSFEITIFPANRVVLQRGTLFHMPFTKGEHGIYLTLRQNSREIKLKETFNLEKIL